MIPIMVLVQQEQVPEAAKKAMVISLEDFTQRHFRAKALIDWMVVPTGSGFTAAKPSTSVVVSMHADRVLSQDERELLITELCELSMKHTERTPHELVASIRDPKMTGAV